MSNRVKAKAPVSYSNPYFEFKHSKTIQDRFFLYNNKISVSLPAVIAQRTGDTFDTKVLDPASGEHVKFNVVCGTFGEVIEATARHFKLK